MITTTRKDDSTVLVRCTGGCKNTFEVPLTVIQERRWLSGALVQDVVPSADADVRELLISGICPRCWDRMFQDDPFHPPAGDQLKR